MVGISAVTRLDNIIKGNKTTLMNSSVIFLTFSSEEIFQRIVFKCPCQKPESTLYGASFLFGPALALLIVGVLVNNVTWRLFTGCCHRTRSTQHGCRKSSVYLSRIITQALVAPAAWIFIAFVDGRYYMCAKATDPCNADDAEHDVLFGESQIIGLIGMLVGITTALVVLLAQRCMDRFTHSQQQFVAMYRAQESEIFTEKAKELAKNLAATNAEMFFSKERRTKLDWDSISVVPLLALSDYEEEIQRPPRHVKWLPGARRIAKTSFIKNLTKPPQSEPCFTPLHKWSMKQKDRLRARQEAEENERLLSGGEQLEDEQVATQHWSERPPPAYSGDAPPSSGDLQHIPMITVPTSCLTIPSLPPE
ncbi:PREDICTED: protein FAM26F-like [Priapulus caudatus]|uniref:Protein FAM26F-like n=1 Tax=Priapulus caudatus TaxID=37621 RepID=A0ABM1DY21_PRICU|nr:PREDICTED: protein FAM26F-like [Priapulus caudatus]XP_014664843.1 PREDICTED: protein FAM26F-like [Priapulus caudatus]XP_014664844.1 PREDICTED: protein FAM26F-like [Priapulus caudatus]XP_014664845.1 PREDICTED: protein FAM26F-like [Priapulus caudatus]